MPNSARDLLPLLQPATKALAQMLAGRTGSSGQLGHARAILAQAERLMAERGHNRLNPAEREEFFEQLARLKLTLADAEAEAESQAAEEEAPAPPPAPPVAQERLKELALALTARAPQRSAAGGLPEDAAAVDEPEPAEPAVQARPAPEPADAAGEAVKSAGNRRAGRLELPRSGGEQLAVAPVLAAPRRVRRTPSPAAARQPDRSPAAPEPEVARTQDAGGNGASNQLDQPQPDQPQPDQPQPDQARPDQARPEAKPAGTRTVRRTRKAAKHQGVPEGWVIDEEGYVVPGPG